MMNDSTWKIMNAVEEAFSEITTFSFLLEKLQEAVDANDTLGIVDTTAALNAFYPVYIQNYDKAFQTAWNHVIGVPQ